MAKNKSMSYLAQECAFWAQSGAVALSFLHVTPAEKAHLRAGGST